MITLSGVSWGPLTVHSLSLPPGTIAITGPNGAGKTLLLELIAGVRLPVSGCIRIGGKAPRETNVGWVGAFPDLNMIFSRTRDEIASSLRFQHLPPGETDTRVTDIAGQLGIVHLLDHPVRTLSGGEKILVAIAAALVCHPDLLILDETDAHLDMMTILKIDRIVRGLHPAWLLFASHREDHIAFADLELPLPLATRPKKPEFHPERGPLSDPDLWRRVYAAEP